MSGAYYVQHGLSRSIAAGSCGCCEGVSVEVPRSIANRPGLSSLAYRIGTHATFFESLLARISTYGVPDPGPQGRLRVPDAPPDRLARLSPGTSLVLPAEARQILPARLLREVLTTRSTTDPAIALLDAWALVADLLTFYQERLANEGFLRTARERRSLYELSRLVGYRPRPGVSASVYLAFEVDDAAALSAGIGPSPIPGAPAPIVSARSEVLIRAGTAARSTPKPGQNEEPQTFETSRDLIARHEWNALLPRLSRMRRFTMDRVMNLEALEFQGTGHQLRTNDFLAVVYSAVDPAIFHRISRVVEDHPNSITRVWLQQGPLSPKALLDDLTLARAGLTIADLPASSHVAAIGRRLSTELDTAFSKMVKQESGAAPTLLSVDTIFHELVCTNLWSPVGSVRKHSVGLINAVQNCVGGIKSLPDTSLAFSALWDPLRAALVRFKEDEADVVHKLNVILADGSTDRPKALLSALKIHASIKSTLIAGVAVLSNGPNAIALSDAERNAFKGLAIELPSDFADSSQYRVRLKVLRGDNGDPTLAMPRKPFILSPTTVSFGLAPDGTSVNADWLLTPTAPPGEPPPDLRAALSTLEFETYVNDGPRRDRDVLGTVEVRRGNNWEPGAVFLGITQNADQARGYFMPHWQGAVFLASGKEASPTSLGLRLVATANPVPRYGVRLIVVTIDGQPPTVTWRPGSVFSNVPSDLQSQYDITPLAEMTTVAQVDELLESIACTPRGSFSGVIIAHVFIDGSPDVSLASAIRLVTAHADANDVLYRRVEKLANDLLNRSDTLLNGAPNSHSANWQADLLSTEAQEISRGLVGDGGALSQLEAAILMSQVVHTYAFVLALISRVANASGLWLDRLNWFGGSLAPAQHDARKQLERARTNALNTLIKCVKGCGSEPLIETFCSGVTNLVNDLGTDLKDAESYERVQDRWAMGSADLAAQAKTVDDRLVSFSNKLMRPLNIRRSRFIATLRKRLSRATPLATGPSEIGRRAAVILDFLDASLEGILRDQSASDGAACDECTKEGASVCPRLSSIIGLVRQQIGGTAHPLSLTEAKNLESAAAMLDGPEKMLLNNLLGELRSLIIQVSEASDVLPRQTRTSDNIIPFAIGMLRRLAQASSSAERTSLQFELLNLFQTTSDLMAQLARVLDPTQRAFLYAVLRDSRIGPPEVYEPKVYAFRSRANLFGWNASVPTAFGKGFVQSLKPGVTCLQDETGGDFDKAVKNANALLGTLASGEAEVGVKLFLDGEFPETAAGGVVAIVQREADPTLYSVRTSQTRPRFAYGLKSQTTEIELNQTWWTPSQDPDPVKASQENFAIIRSTRVYCDSVALPLAEATESTNLPVGNSIECQGLVDGLSLGKPIIVSGSAVQGENGLIPQSEVHFITDVDLHIDTTLYGDTISTVITLARNLAYSYRRESVRIYANVVEATHGETLREVLGSGNGAVAFQQFALKRPEVSQLSAPTSTGTESTLTIRVNDVQWDEREGGFLEAQPETEGFVTLTDDQQRMSVVFGDGVNGARLPTGLENVQAVYRAGIGQKGNVDPGQIDQAVGAPLGVKKVINPLRAQGGADPEPEESLREHIPLAVTALDRLVSVADYADFARSYAGIGKASAARLAGVVYVTIAGGEPAPLDSEGPIMQNLRTALRRFGDPSQRFELHNREAALLIVVAKVRIESRRLWEKVEPEIRQTLLETFHYQRADLGEDVRQADVIAAIQAVNGVVYVDLEVFDAVNESEIGFLSQRLGLRRVQKRIHVPAERITSLQEEFSAAGIEVDSRANTPALVKENKETDKPSDPNAVRFRPAQVCYLPADVPDALILEQLR